MKVFLTASAITITNIIFPDMQLLMWMVVALVLDFITGVAKSFVKREARTSRGFRQTITKVVQYGGSLIVGMILTNTAQKNNMPGAAQLISFFDNGLLVFMIYIEVTSIFENLFAMSPDAPISQRFFKPILNLLTFQLKNNPATQTKPDEEATH